MKNLFICLILLSFVFVSSAQFAQWRGPDRDGQFPATNLLKSWPENGPELILQVKKIGKGWSSPILVGDIKYEDVWDTKGAMVMADGLLYCYNEKGNVALVSPDPAAFKVISKFKITEGAGPHWAHPFIAGGKMLIRHGDVLLVFNIKA